MHYLVTGLLANIRAHKKDSGLNYSHWDRGFIHGQLHMFRCYAKELGLQEWEVQYVVNVAQAKFHSNLSGV